MGPANESSTAHVTGFQIESVGLGLASPAARVLVSGHLETCAACARLAATLADAHREFTGEVLPRTRPALRSALTRQRRRIFAWASAALLLPATAVIVTMARPHTGVIAPTSIDRSRGSADLTEPSELGVKGGPMLLIAARRDARVFRPGAHDPVQPGDQIRFVIQHATLPFVLIASVDGAGQASIYLPYQGAASAPMPAGNPVEIDGSIVLDTSPGPERIFALFSHQPLASDDVRAALEALGQRGPGALRAISRLDVAAAEQVSVLLEKVTR